MQGKLDDIYLPQGPLECKLDMFGPWGREEGREDKEEEENEEDCVCLLLLTVVSSEQ